MARSKLGRTLKILATRGPTGPTALAVTLIASACGSTVTIESTPSAGGGGVGGVGGVGGSVSSMSSGGNTTTFATVGGGGVGGTDPCDGAPSLNFTVEIPPEGVPADAGQICSVVMGPVESNNAARVTLVKDSQLDYLAKGEVTVAPALLSDVVGLPTIAVVGSQHPQLQQMVVSNVTPTSTGFTFDASFPPTLNLGGDPFVLMMIVRTTFDLQCGLNEVRQVEAHTHLNVCHDDQNDTETWVSSGDECLICGIIAEMAPSPIVPNKAVDDIGLGKVICLRLVIVARIGDSLLLLAEHDGGDGLSYDWRASAGEVVRVTPDIVLWTPPAQGGPHLMQVAAFDDDAAAVASYTNAPVREAGFVA